MIVDAYQESREAVAHLEHVLGILATVDFTQPYDDPAINKVDAYLKDLAGRDRDMHDTVIKLIEFRTGAKWDAF